MEESSYAPGDYVVVQGLVKTPEVNGKIGEVKGEGKEGRITIRLVEGNHRLLNVKGANLKAGEDAEVEAALRAELEQIAEDDLKKVLVEGGVKCDAGSSKDKMVNLAVENQLFPEVPKRITNYQNFDPEEEVQVPGAGPMKRRDMWEQANQLESMTIQQMQAQVRTLKNRSIQELRQMNPAFKDMTEIDVKMQVAQMEGFVANPQMKKLQIDALRSGDFSRVNSPNSMAGMDDDSMRRDARMKLEMFKKDPKGFRDQYLQSEEYQSLTDDQIEDQLRSQATADSKTLKAMRNAAQGGNVDMSALSDEQLKKNSELQLKMFNDNPKQFRKKMESQNPQVKSMTDDQLKMQLETMASMSPADIRAMQSLSSSMGGGSMDPNNPQASMDKLNDMNPEQLSAMFKMQRDMFKKDPKKFKETMPQFATMPDSMIETQLDTMADMPPEYLKWYINSTNSFMPYLNMIKEPLDKITGGYGAQILLAIAVFVVLTLLYYFFGMVYRLLAFLFPMTFGSGAAGVAPGGDVFGKPNGAPEVPVQQVDLDGDEFFQQDDL